MGELFYIIFGMAVMAFLAFIIWLDHKERRRKDDERRLICTNPDCKYRDLPTFSCQFEEVVLKADGKCSKMEGKGK